MIRDGVNDARLAELIIALPGGTTRRRWRAIARAMGGGWSADECLCHASFLARLSSTASEKGRNKLDGAAQMVQPEPDLDEKDECVVLSGAEDDSFNVKYYRFYTEDEEDDLVCYRHTSNDSETTYLWRLTGGTWGYAFESYFN